MRRTATFFIIMLFLTQITRATIIEVPGDYAEIQQAIDASSNGDTIVVMPDTYYENINFHGKNVVLTSLYYLDADTTYIISTVINGSMPTYPDTASCVIFNSGEGQAAVLQGFTLTGGAGTKWTDIHGAGVYREGGGVLIELSSPVIMHNLITGNACTDLTGVTSTGGGGIRIGDGNPVIANNTIINNIARYGAGIVLNYTGCLISNNVIASNTGGQSYYGGSGIWIYGNLVNNPKYINNNTIVNNESTLTSGTGGISVWSATLVFISNNIVYNNIPDLQIKTVSATVLVSFSDVMGGFTGPGNIDTLPHFQPESYLLYEDSPGVDQGDTLEQLNDLEDPESPGMALFPSMGTVRNDMGAYGGPLASILPFVLTVTGIAEDNNVNPAKAFIFPNPSSGTFTLQGSGDVSIYNSAGRLVLYTQVNTSKVIDMKDFPDGIYFVRINKGQQQVCQKIIVER